MVAQKINLICIVGPTASGKTGLSIKLAKHFDAEIISADSRAIYKKMDIGTAKPDKNEQQGVRHWGIDLVGPGESFTVSDFKHYANQTIKNIRQRNKLPILVGGSGLYIDSVLYDFSFVPPNPALRDELKNKSIHQLHEIIKNKHLKLPINHNNIRHLTRAIEVGAKEPTKNKIAEGVLILGICPDRERLKISIKSRLNNMLSSGVEKEIKNCAAIYGWDSIAMTGGIYRSFRSYIGGGVTLEEAKRISIKSDMALAKKQMTWFRRNKDVKWFDDAGKALAWFMSEFKGKL